MVILIKMRGQPTSYDLIGDYMNNRWWDMKMSFFRGYFSQFWAKMATLEGKMAFRSVHYVKI